MSDEKISQIDEDTFLATSEKFERKSLEKSIYEYNNKSNFRSTYFNESNASVQFKIEDIDTLAFNPQNNLLNSMRINNIIRLFVNKNDILGKVYEAIETNVNPDWQLSYPNYVEDEKETYDLVDSLIKDFNAKINLDSLIVDAIPMAYLEGNYFIYLRKDKSKNNYQVDYYPIGVCEVSDYTEGGEPYILINVKELESRLRKIYKKTNKNKTLFYKDMDEEIKDAYPEEVFTAYKNKEQYAILDIENSGLVRVNNMKRKYGLSPIFKSLKPVVRLENIELSDDKNTLVRGKKIIFQKLSMDLVTKYKEIPNITWSGAQAKAHSDLMAALSGKGVSVYTGTPWVEKVEFVEPKLAQTNVQIKNQYRNEIMSAVGISYLSVDKGTYGAAKVSISELMKVINKIAKQLENILIKWYKGILVDNNIDVKYCPKIKIIDSEKLSMDVSLQLARALNTELNSSLESVYSVLGLDVKTEAKRRESEKELGYEEIFKPRMTAHTNNGKTNDSGGRPSGTGDDPDKMDSDNEYNEENDR